VLWRQSDQSFANRSQEAALHSFLEFPAIARLGAFVAFLLFVTFAFIPVLPFTMVGVAMTPEALLMARRMSALFLGISLLLWRARDAEDSALRRNVCASFSIAMAALALFGLWDFVHSSVGYGIWIAITVETFFAAALGFHARETQASAA
jgi:hypothetical protein